MARRKTRRQPVELPHHGHISASSFSTRLSSKGIRPQNIKKGQKQDPLPLRRSARLARLIEIKETQQNPSQQPLPSLVSDVESLHVSRQRLFCDGRLTDTAYAATCYPSTIEASGAISRS